MIRMLLVGYCFGIRSERRLCEEVHLNLAYGWFCRLGLDGAVPDHSTFSKNRHGRFRESDLLRESSRSPRALHRRRPRRRRRLRGRRQPHQGGRQQAVLEAGRDGGPPDGSLDEALVREYLDTLDEVAWGAASEVKPKFVSKSDPAAQWTGPKGGHAFFAYGPTT